MGNASSFAGGVDVELRILRDRSKTAVSIRFRAEEKALEAAEKLCELATLGPRLKMGEQSAAV